MNHTRMSLAVTTLAALVTMGFTNAPATPTVAADSTWEAVLADFQGPQNPAASKKVADEDTTMLLGTNDLSLSSWPGLSTVGGLSTLPSPMGGGSPGVSNLGGGSGGPSPVLPVPTTPWTPGRVLPAAPTEPLSQFEP